MFKFTRKNVLVSLTLFALLFASCGPEAPTDIPMDVNDILTAGVGTLAASIFETQTAMVPPPTQTLSITSTATNTALPLPASPGPSVTQGFVFIPVAGTSSVSPTPTGTRFTPTVNPLTLATGCNNLLLISDVTIPAGTIMKPEEQFTKTWKVGNNGTCNWALQYRLVFVGGNQMGGEPSGLGKVIEINKWTQISIGLVAPKQPGTYTGTWRLGTQTGTAFGSTLTVSIVVASPTNTPQPTLSFTPVTPSAIPSETPSPTSSPTETSTTAPPPP
jgi:hypothetical protein